MGGRVLAFVKESRIGAVVVKQTLGLTNTAAAAAAATAIGGRMMRWRFSYKIGVGIRSLGILLATTEECCYEFSPKLENGT